MSEISTGIDQQPETPVASAETEPQPQPQIKTETRPTFRDRLRPFIRPATRIAAAVAFLAVANQARGLPNSPDHGPREDSQSGLSIPNPLEPGLVDAQVPRRIYVPMIGKDPTPAPTETPKPLTELEQWYLNAQEVPGTRVTKIVNGKECLLRSVIDSGATYEFHWNGNFPDSLVRVRDFMCQDEMGQGYVGQEQFDELDIGVSANRINGVLYEQLGQMISGKFNSWGYFGRKTFEINGKKIRMAVWSPPTKDATPDYITRASRNTALQLVYVSVAGDTDPGKVTTEQDTRMNAEKQSYLDITTLVNR